MMGMMRCPMMSAGTSSAAAVGQRGPVYPGTLRARERPARPGAQIGGQGHGKGEERRRGRHGPQAGGSFAHPMETPRSLRALSWPGLRSEDLERLRCGAGSPDFDNKMATFRPFAVIDGSTHGPPSPDGSTIPPPRGKCEMNFRNLLTAFSRKRLQRTALCAGVEPGR
jgi:hypothetical protein